MRELRKNPILCFTNTPLNRKWVFLCSVIFFFFKIIKQEKNDEILRFLLALYFQITLKSTILQLYMLEILC